MCTHPVCREAQRRRSCRAMPSVLADVTNRHRRNSSAPEPTLYGPTLEGDVNVSAQKATRRPKKVVPEGELGHHCEKELKRGQRALIC